VIHRDLKPSNVIVALYDGEPIPKVIDFGIAKAIQQKLTPRTMQTEAGQILGTLEYMAPEQADLANVDVDTRSDIYSLGVLLYELLTGSPPFPAAAQQDVGILELLRILREVEPVKPSARLAAAGEQLPLIAQQRTLEAGSSGRRRPGLDRPEVPGERACSPLRNGQRSGSRPGALPAGRAGVGWSAVRRLSVS
jgi:serine/threonine protein kinase